MASAAVVPGPTAGTDAAATHAVCPVLGAVPAGQAVQPALPAVGAIVLPEQSVQPGEPIPENVPAAQDEQLAEPASE
jgi:hypothetical protein